MARILVIDDEEPHNLLNIILFRSAGITDVEAKLSAMAGLKYLTECDKGNIFPELIFVDLHMAGMDGFAFLNQYEEKFAQYNFKSRVIILTNSILDKEKEMAMKYPSVIDVLSKPLTKNKIQELLERVDIKK